MGRDSGASPIVGISVADPGVRSRLTVLVRECGGCPGDVTLDLPGQARCDAVIHDLSPWTQASIEKFRVYHHQVPQVPFLLYVPPGSARASLIGACAALCGVRLEVHKSPLEERPILRQHIAWLLNAAPGQQVLHILRVLFPDAPPRVSRFFRRVLEQIAQGSMVGRASVAKSAAGAWDE